jgi:hypothetical protein
MRSSLISGIIVCVITQSWAIWVPTPNTNSPIAQQEGILDPPGTTDSSYTWVDIPDVGITILPPIAANQRSVGSVSSQTAEAKNVQTIKKEEQANAEAVQRDATIPRFNDVSCDVEYGMLSFTTNSDFMPDTKYSGYGISAKGRYERMPDDYTGFGVRVQNEYTAFTWVDDTVKSTLPGSDFLLMGGFYRKTVYPNLDIGCQTNLSLFFRTTKQYNNTTTQWEDKKIMDWALNPALFGIYNMQFGQISCYGGGFGGYQYASFSYTKHQFPYAAIVGCGTTFGQYVAAQVDVAASHQFVILGAQVPIYFSRLFSITPGVKYPIVFEATTLQNLRMTVGVSSRF